MTKIISMASALGDATKWTSEDALKSALEDARNSQGKKNKCLILMLDDSEGCYHVSYTQSGMKASELLSLLEVAKTNVLRQMSLS